jgi:L-threonylcarbamoyladenylate synthase
LITEAVRRLKDGELVAFPTETVYGLGADAKNSLAIEKIYATKGRPSTHPLIVHIAAPSAVTTNQQLSPETCANEWLQVLTPWVRDLPPAALQLICAFWPGPLTLVFKKDKHVLDAITGGQSTVAIRSPNHLVAQTLLQQFGGALVAPSANRFGKVSPTRAADVCAEFGDQAEIMVLDGGDCELGIESTIVDLSSSDGLRLLRPGSITPAAIYAKTGLRVDSINTASELSLSPRVSGSFKAHYAPNTPLYLYQADHLMVSLEKLATQLLEKNHPGKLRVAIGIWQGAKSVSTLAADAALSSIQLEFFTLPNEHTSFANGLYRSLRDLDQQQNDAIFLPEPPYGEIWDGVRDRLQRAAFGSGPSSANQVNS